MNFITRRKKVATCCLIALLSAFGCNGKAARNLPFNRSVGLVQPTIEQSPIVLDELTGSAFSDALVEPLSLRNPMKEQWLITPSEAVQIAVQRSKVLQDLGGAVLRSTNSIATIHEPGIQSTDPRLGVEAALSAFDAQFNSRMFANKNDYQVNNRLLGGGTNLLQQDLVNFQNEITKTTAYGTDVYFRKNTIYDANNAPSNLFTSTWQTNLELGFRHPLARGGGLDYNRIAGPKATPGNYSGILIARINEDTSIIDFEIALRDLISDVENAYWDLYFSYRNLEAKIAARDAALDTWRVEQLLREKMAESGEKETRAREQYHRFQAQVIEALTGREVDGTRTNNGSSGGTFRSVEGVHVAERRLRMLMNLPINDTKMLRPSHDPVLVNVMFDWQQSAIDALDLRPELRKQDLAVTRSSLELIASKNALMPQFDLISQYRIRGLGNDLWGSSTVPFDNAVGTMASGAFQEWQFGLEMNLPVGFRRAYNNVRNAQLKLARDKDVLLQKQRRVIHDLSNAYSGVVRSYEVAQVALEQRAAAHEQLAILRNLEQNNSRVNVNEILDAQSRASQADTALFEAMVRYMISLKNIHYERGTLFEYNNIAFVDRVVTRRALNTTGEMNPSKNEQESSDPTFLLPEAQEVSGVSPSLMGPPQEIPPPDRLLDGLPPSETPFP